MSDLDSDSANELADELVRSEREILARWLVLARAPVERRAKEAPVALAEYVPHVLADVVAALRRSGPAAVRCTPDDKKPAPSIGPGATLSQAIAELGLLRRVLVETLSRTSPKSWLVVQESIDRATAEIGATIAQRSESSLAREIERLRRLTEVTSDVVWELDPATNKVEWRGAMDRMFGYSDPTVGADLDWWKERMHPEDRVRVLSILRRMVDHADDRAWAEYRLQRADGVYIPVFARARGVLENGKTVRILGSLIDLTERVRADEIVRESSERLAIALAAADIGTWDYDPRTGGIEWDARLREISGYEPEEPVNYDRFLDGVHPEDRPWVDDLVKQTLHPDSGGAYSVEYRMIRKNDGAMRWIAARGKVLYDTHGSPVRFIGTSIDATERRRAAEFRERFMGIVGHDLRQPLSVVRFGAAALADRTALSEPDRIIVRRLVQAGERMTRMIGDLLDFARGRQGGGIPVDRQPGDLFSVVRHLVSELEAVHPDREFRLIANGGGDGAWDRDRMMQAFGNLLANAIAYGAAAHPIDVTLAEGKTHLVVAVTNQGPAIPDGEIGSLFDPYRRGRSRKDAKPTGGLGLGLYIASEIVRAHGGAIQVTSNPDEGTTFRVEFPRSAEAQP